MQIKYLFLLIIFMIMISSFEIVNTIKVLITTVKETVKEQQEVHPPEMRLAKIERVAEMTYLCLKLVFFLIVIAFFVALLAAVVSKTGQHT